MGVRFTARTGAPVVDGTEDMADSVVYLGQQADKFDENFGIKPVTSGNRPPTPYPGELIEETDTGRIYRWRPGSPGEWRYVTGPSGDLVGESGYHNAKLLNAATFSPLLITPVMDCDIVFVAEFACGFSTAEASLRYNWEKHITAAGSGSLAYSDNPPEMSAATGKSIFVGSSARVNNVKAGAQTGIRLSAIVATTDAAGTYFRGRVRYNIYPRGL